MTLKERLKALYANGLNGVSPSIQLDKILNAVFKRWITVDEAVEIVGDNGTDAFEILRAVKLKEVSKACEDVIFAGTDVELGNEVLHFSLTIKDQINLSTAISAVVNGALAFPYHNDGNLCRLYSAAEINKIGAEATRFILYHTTYCNHLNYYIRRIEDVGVFESVFYGCELPSDLADNMQSVLLQAQGE